MPTPPLARSTERGASLVEVMVALVVLAVGILAVARLFPAGSQSQLQSRMTSNASYFARQKSEYLRTLPGSHADLGAGRHPAGSATEDLGDGGQWHRFYDVASLPAPLTSVRRIVVTVNWTWQGTKTVRDTIYLRR